VLGLPIRMPDGSSGIRPDVIRAETVELTQRSVDADLPVQRLQTNRNGKRGRIKKLPVWFQRLLHGHNLH